MKKIIIALLSVIMVVTGALCMISCVQQPPVGGVSSATSEELPCGIHEHSFALEETVAPTCSAQGYDVMKCITCNAVCYMNYTEVIDHEWQEALSYNATFHWFNCTHCDAVNQKEEHVADENNLCTVCSMPVDATEGVLYDLSSDGTYYEVIGYTGTATSIRFAESINGLPVKTIYSEAFCDNDIIKVVIIPNSVTSIGDDAFSWCSSLTSVVIGDSVTSIGDDAFASCDALTSVVIGDSVTSIGGFAFLYCSSLTSVVIPNSVTFIGDLAFYNCESLTSIKVSENNVNYKDIDGNLYSKDGSVLIQYAIGKTTTSFTIPDSVTSIGGFAFLYCSSLTSVVIGDSVTSIGDRAFYSCSSLTSVVIGDSVTSISSSAFENCSNLQFNEYENCKYLGSKDNPYFALISVSNQNLSSYAIHANTKVIAESVFDNCARLTSIVIPDSVTSIGEEAFYGCRSLTSVVIGDSVTSIGDGAFAFCNALTSVVIGDSVTSIGKSAFYSCSSLKEVYYNGTADGWANISIGSSNYELTSVTLYYYSESQPTSSGNYWHYDENANVVKW